MLQKIRWERIVISFLVIALISIIYLFFILPLQIRSQLGESGLIVEQHVFGWRTPPQWTPDGAHIVFVHKGGIYIVDTGGADLRRIHGWVDDNDRYDSPNLSPDGSRIAYLKLHRDWFWEEHRWEIATSELDGSREHILTDLDGTNYSGRFGGVDGVVGSPSWSPDGRQIAFDLRGMVYTMSEDGSDLHSVAMLSSDLFISHDAHGVFDLGMPLAWSPDGRQIAFLGGPFDYYRGVVDERQGAMYVTGSDGLSVKKIAETTGMPAWSPGGAQLAFVRVIWDQRGDPSYAEQLYMIRRDGSDLREITRLPEKLRWDRVVTWSPDGTEILAGPFVVNVEGSILHVLPEPDRFEGFDWEPRSDHFNQTSWSSDGARIAIQTTYDTTRGSDHPTELYTVKRDGSDARVLVITDRQGNLSPGGGVLLRDGQEVKTIHPDQQGP